MVDQNDSFIREVNEELRSDQVRNAWKRYSRIIIGAAVVIVLGTAGHRLWTHWDSTQASDAGDKFLAALTLADQGKRVIVAGFSDGSRGSGPADRRRRSPG